MPEEKFEPLAYSAEYVAALRRQMDQTVDARALAAKFTAARSPMNQNRLAALAAAGIDGNRTLTELEGADLGDGHQVADDAEVHALRHVPLGLWGSHDIHLMLLYGQGGGTTLALALYLLARDTLVEALYYPGDLLVAAAGAAAGDPELPDGTSGRAAIVRVLSTAGEALRAGFDRRAQQLELDEFEADDAWRALQDGRLDAGDRRFSDEAGALNRLAEARELVEPAPVLLAATAELIYSNHTARLQIVNAEEFADPTVRAVLELPGAMWFRRETAFSVVRTGDHEVRLRHLARSAIENWHGIAFADVDAALAHAGRAFGVGHDKWHKVPDAGDSMKP